MCRCWILVALVIAPDPPKLDDKKPAFKLSEDEQTVLDLTNAERRKLKLPPLKANELLTKAAREHSANMAKQKKMDHVLDDLRQNGVTQDELDRAKRQFLAEFVYESDSQVSLARRYGSGLALGLTVEQIDRWPETIAKVTLDDVKRAARHLDMRHSVTGTLVPVKGSGGVSAARSEAEGTFAWNWARTIWADSLA